MEHVLTTPKQLLVQLQAERVQRYTTVQSLWSGYGAIWRVWLDDGSRTVILKHVLPPAEDIHPRGWNGEVSKLRKWRSYQVECQWYECEQPNDSCRWPRAYWVSIDHQQAMMALEDLDAVGLDQRLQPVVSENHCQLALAWLAQFHARYLGRDPSDLWPRGTYWHLQTRPDEYEAMPAGDLREAAKPLDEMLQQAQFKTWVHGDAKVANFCFGRESESPAAVDFQYVGGGVGVQDVAYFLGSCLDESALFRLGETLVDFYFEQLSLALRRDGCSAQHVAAVVVEWRHLYPVAWADFERFLAGWSPQHSKRNRYSELQTALALRAL